MGKTCFLFVAAVWLLKCCFIASLDSTVTNLTTDQSALLAFKSQITIHPEDVLANNWSATTSVCHWIGVSCGAGGQRVTALNLTDMGLGGTISPHLGNLSFLASLDISYNSFHGNLPEQLGHLHQLEELFLNNNSFGGAFPSLLGNISKLQILNIRYNSLQGEIPEEIGNLSNLKLLDLSFNQLTGSIPSAIFNKPSLEFIDLTANNLSDSLPIDMCNHLPKLETLSLSLNQLRGQIPLNLCKCSGLQILSLSDNLFNGSIPREIGNLAMLKELYLGGNRLKGVIPQEMANLTSLEVLSLRIGSLTGPVPSSIFNMSSLKVIDCKNNNLSGSLPVNIQYHLPVLEVLDLSSNQFSGQIPSNLWECKGLRSLLFLANGFTGNISKNIGNLTLLKELDLGQNNLTGLLPEEIGNLNLERFWVDENNLTGVIPSKIFNISTLKLLTLASNDFFGRLPSNLGNRLPNLVSLHLGCNKLSGTIPSSISNASSLTFLDMQINSFTGFIPNTLGNLRVLQRLFLGGNNLTRESSTLELRFFSSLTNCRQLELLVLSLNQLNGILPNSVGNLSNSLYIFEAFGSKMIGNIPSEIGNLSNLGLLSLDNNELTGPIPTTLGRLQHLEHLYLEHNRLQGHIPYNLCQMKKLGDLYVSHNELYGPIPICLGELGSLRRLFLDSNNLTSIIPSNLWSLRDLLLLNLSTNSLEGNLPLVIGNLKAITQIDLSWNQLSGDIPNSIGGAQSLAFLSLANNTLQGSIPQSLGNLISLEVLDLSNNNLSGEIPKSLEALRYLEYLNVSFNRLHGEIPTGGHFANFTTESFRYNDALCGAPQLQVPPCKMSTPRQSRSKILPLLKYILPPVALGILIVAIIFVLIRCKKQNIQLPITNADLLPRVWRRISYHELLRATNAFSESNLLGTGSFGLLYKGTLSDGMNIAVKVFNLQVEGTFKSFDVECEVMRNIRHRNLVKVISNCTNMDFKALLLEYMPNGSLEKWLYSHNYCLDILQRLKIMIDVALALEYLHHGQTTPVVHCDLKPSNVLLDEDMVARVGDFGIAKLLSEGEAMAQTITLATIGYMAPEYGTEGIISTRGDVYSYGVMLMEVFTRKKPTDELFSGEMSLKYWVSKSSHDGSLVEIVDTNLIRKEDVNFSTKMEFVSSILQLAMDCSIDLPDERIHMKDAVVTLKKIKVKFLAITERA